MFNLRLGPQVPINFSFVNVQPSKGPASTRWRQGSERSDSLLHVPVVCDIDQVELKEENFRFLLVYVGLFPQIPTSKERQARQ